VYNKTINIAVVAEIARALGILKEQMIFVGGSIISLYTDDPAADEIRPTADIDMTISVLNYTNWVELQEKMLRLGFSPDPEAPHINRLLFKQIPVDVIPMEDGIIGASNRWYKVGQNHILEKEIEHETIKIFSAPIYLATKFETFNGRGGDYRMSHDFEDIIYVLDNRIKIVEEISKTDKEALEFLQLELQKIIESPFSEEYLSAHIHPLMIADRYPLLVEKIDQILSI